MKKARRMDSEKLIEAVRGFDCIWNVKNASYKDRRKRENAWKEVSNVVRCLAH